MHTSPGLRHAFVRVAPVVGIATSLVVVWWIVMGPILGSDPWTGFRLYFANDQLSYARIATNVANGGPWFSEPFTHTGTSYYPSPVFHHWLVQCRDGSLRSYWLDAA